MFQVTPVTYYPVESSGTLQVTQHNSYTNTDCIYSVYVMVLELIVQKFYLGLNKNRPQPQVVNNIRVIYRFEVRFVLL